MCASIVKCVVGKPSCLTRCRGFTSKPWLPAKMRTVQVGPAAEGSKRPGPESLVCEEVLIPSLGPKDVLIKVAAAGVNRPDIMQRLGLYDPPRGHSKVLGLEVAGEVVAIGNDVTSHAVGSQVCALTNGGGYAEYCPAPEGQVLRVPKRISMQEAACVPEAFFTVWYNLFQQSNVFGSHVYDRKGFSILVHGGSSGIGTTAIQLARAFGAGSIIATAGSESKCKACVELGATRAVNYKNGDDFVKAVLDETEGKGVDMVLDMVVGKGYTQSNIDVLRPGGRLAIIGFLGGAKAEVNMTKVLTKGLTVSGSTLRTLSNEDKAAIAVELEAQVWPMLEDGSVRVVMDSVFNMEDAPSAHRKMEESGHVGKIGLNMKKQIHHLS